MSATVSAVVLYPKKYTRPASCETIETTPKLSSFSHFPHLPQMVSYVGKHRSLTFGAYIEISSHFNRCCPSRAVGAASKASKRNGRDQPCGHDISVDRFKRINWAVCPFYWRCRIHNTDVTLSPPCIKQGSWAHPYRLGTIFVLKLDFTS